MHLRYIIAKKFMVNDTTILLRRAELFKIASMGINLNLKEQDD